VAAEQEVTKAVMPLVHRLLVVLAAVEHGQPLLLVQELLDKVLLVPLALLQQPGTVAVAVVVLVPLELLVQEALAEMVVVVLLLLLLAHPLHTLVVVLVVHLSLPVALVVLVVEEMVALE
jgi:hypothetical protein